MTLFYGFSLRRDSYITGTESTCAALKFLCLDADQLSNGVIL